MPIQYASLFELRLHHDYFTAGDCRVVDILPAPSTARLMQQLSIRQVARDYGAEFFYSTDATAGSPLQSINEPIRLSFFLRPTDARFLNYTDFPLTEREDHISYFTNLNAAANQALVFKANGSQRIPVRAVLPLEGSEVKDELGNVVSESEYPMNGAGVYSTEDADGLPVRFAHGGDGWQRGHLALISIYLGDTGINGQHLLSDGQVTPTTFTVAFSARATKWRYYIIDRSQDGYQHFQLLDHGSEQPVSTSPPPLTTKTLPDGSEAVVLLSEELIPFRERPGLRFRLSMEATGGHTSNIPLPSADANQLGRADSGTTGAADTFFYSDLYVYL